MRLKTAALFGLNLMALLPGTSFAADGVFMFPVNCTVGKNCWVPNYVDLQPGPGVRDYNCKTATYDALPDNQHKGMDIAVRDLAEMNKGVDVRAAATGIVVGRRDGVEDLNIKDRRTPLPNTQACGNGVRIQHNDDLTTQYCHMKKGSIAVKAGARVEQGQRLGQIGLSGLTSYPHLHFQVSQGKTIVDPFAGLNRVKACGIGEKTLWTEQALAQAPYQPTAIYNAGFARQKPDFKAISAGLYKTDHFPLRAPALVLWAEFFRVEAGDRLTFEITDHSGQTLHKKDLPIRAKKAHYVAFSGLRLKAARWQPGVYMGTVTLTRDTLARGQKTFVTRRKLILQ